MSTNTQIVTDALRELRLVAEGESATADQAGDALRVLNQMMESWAVEDIDLQYFAQTSLSDTCPIPAWAEKGVVAALALELASGYGSAVTDTLAKRASDGYAVIARQCLNAKLQSADMRHLGAGNARYNILTDR